MFATRASRTEPVLRPLAPAELDGVVGGFLTILVPPPGAALIALLQPPPIPWFALGTLPGVVAD
jgi:hypothetical protein